MRYLPLLMLLLSVYALAGNRVGNGDEGGDLEGAQKITGGPIVDSREDAVAKLKALNVTGIPGLGKLLPEVERANLYLADLDVAGGNEDGPRSPEGLIYARTLPEEHAPTRFFPIATWLNKDQLVALHIHEGLHRSLPLHVREDENVVTRLTLAITAPEATHDGVALTASQLVPSDFASIRQSEHFQAPSNVGYSFRQFIVGDTTSTYPIERMHVFHSDLYPFGGSDSPLGFGIEATLINRPGITQSGPLSLSAKMRLWSIRGFDIGLYAVGTLNVLSADELKNSPFGRDVFTLGVSMRKNLKRFYVENTLGYTFQGKSARAVGKVLYHYSYGGTVTAKIRGGARLGVFDLGGFAELNLAEHFRVNGGAFDSDFGRYRIFAMGPELTYSQEDYSVGLSGRFLVDSTRGANFDYLGDLMGPGVAQGGIQLSGKILF